MSQLIFSIPLLLGLTIVGCRKSDNAENQETKIKSALFGAEMEAPATLEDTKLFLDGDVSQPFERLIRYEVRTPLWSDGAIKTRYIYVPDGEHIEQNPTNDALIFPVGTTLVKHFATPGESSIPIETRISVLKDDGTWHFFSYIWTEDGSHAELNTRAKKISKAGVDYRIPSEQECKTCHESRGPVLGFQISQLNSPEHNQDNELLKLAARGLFATPNAKLIESASLPDVRDSNLSSGARARAYLQVNCASCHNPAGPSGANRFDLGMDMNEEKLVSLGLIVPGNPDESVLWQRFSAQTNRMPPISLRADTNGLNILRDYIQALPK